MRLSGICVVMAIAWLGHSGCSIAIPAVEGIFERTLNVTGPVRLDVSTGSGKIEIKAGSPGTVRIFASVKARDDGRATAEEKLRYLQANPPIEQDGNDIRIGRIEEETYRSNISISFEIETPGDTQSVTRAGSGSQRIDGIGGPVDASTGSGSIFMTNIGSDVDAQTGSGSIDIYSVAGGIDVRTGSGSIKAEEIAGSVKASTGSGRISVKQTMVEMGARRNVEVSTGSGNIEIDGTAGPLKARTGSGDIKASGNPIIADWNIATSSGSVTLEVPPDAAFDLSVSTSSGRISVDHPVTMSGTMSRNNLRGKVRGGGTMVKIRTSSGSVTIR